MIVIVCGPPGAGKTTIVAHLGERLARPGWEFRVLHSDDFSRHPYDRMYERVVGSDGDWLLDGTFYRREFQDRFRTLGAKFVYVTASLETCLQRNRDRESPIDERGVYALYHGFEAPDADLTIDAEATAPEDAAEAIAAAIEAWCDER